MRCPKLRRQGGAFNPRHGDCDCQLELPRTSEGKRRQARRAGLESQEQAWEKLDHLKALLELAQGEPDLEVQIADLIQNALKARTRFPSVAEVRARSGAGADARWAPEPTRTFLTHVKVLSVELGHSTAHFTQDTYQTVFREAGSLFVSPAT
ncbi:Integrase [Nocardiopsis sp. JB363]|nr:Integrase [Nocardiopsis sp. JB363]